MNIIINSIQSPELRDLVTELDNGDGVVEEHEIIDFQFNGYIDLSIIPAHWTYNDLRRVQQLFYDRGLLTNRYGLVELLGMQNPRAQYIQEEVVVEGEDYCGSIIYFANVHDINYELPGLEQRMNTLITFGMQAEYFNLVFELLSSYHPEHIFFENQRRTHEAGTSRRYERSAACREIFPQGIATTDFNLAQIDYLVARHQYAFVDCNPDVFVHRTISPEDFREIFGSDDIRDVRVTDERLEEDAERYFFSREGLAMIEIGLFLFNNSDVSEVWLMFGFEHSFEDEVRELRCVPTLIVLELLFNNEQLHSMALEALDRFERVIR